MRIAVIKETTGGERRVALVPDIVQKLVKGGLEIRVQATAGTSAGFTDAQFVAAGARVFASVSETLAEAAITLKVQRPTEAEVGMLPEGSTLVCFLQPAQQAPLLSRLAARKVNALAMEYVPRTTRAQSVDALSSQATVEGYKAVLVGASLSPRLLPMLTTAAGTLTPGKTLVIGVGVAGLQALATARRLGSVTYGFDVRPAVKEQVQSLGAKFVELEGVGKEAESSGGYAKELAEDQRRRVLEAVGKAVLEMDLVISTAQIPGRPAPKLITAQMVERMKPGAVIVDCAAASGGNCELTQPGSTMIAHDVIIDGPLNLASTVPQHASQMYAKNLQNLLALLIKEAQFKLDLADDIIAGMLVTLDGEVRPR